MTNTVERTVHCYWAAWSVRDKAAAVGWLADDVEVSNNISTSTLLFGGKTVGLRAMSDRMQSSIDLFERLHYEATLVGLKGRTVRGHISFAVRHRLTGETIDGVARQMIEVRDGRIIRIQEYHDAERIAAFMRLVSHCAAEQRLLQTLITRPGQTRRFGSGDGPWIE